MSVMSEAKRIRPRPMKAACGADTEYICETLYSLHNKTISAPHSTEASHIATIQNPYLENYTLKQKQTSGMESHRMDSILNAKQCKTKRNYNAPAAELQAKPENQSLISNAILMRR